MTKPKKSAKSKARHKTNAKNKQKQQQLNKLKSFDFSKSTPISNTAAIEERNEQILANLPKSRYKSDGTIEYAVKSNCIHTEGPGYVLTAEFASDVSDCDDFPFGADSEKIKQLKELREDLDTPVENLGLASLTAIPGFSCGFNNVQESKEFIEFTQMIKEQGYEQSQEFDDEGNLRSVSFTQVKKKKKKKKKKRKKKSSSLTTKTETETTNEMCEKHKIEHKPLPKISETQQKLDLDMKKLRLSSSKESFEDKKSVEVHVNVNIGFDKQPSETQSNSKSQVSTKTPYFADQSIKGAETEIGKSIEAANDSLLDKARVSCLNCEDVAKHTAFLAEQRQALKDHMEALQKKIRIHNSLIKVNGRNLLKHFTIVTSLEKAIFATKRDSIRFNIILNQFLSSPAYATMLESFERVTQKMPKNSEKKTVPSELFDFDYNYSSFEDLLAQEKKSLSFDLKSNKNS